MHRVSFLFFCLCVLYIQYAHMLVSVCTVRVVMPLIKVSAQHREHPSHGLSADFAESRFDRHTANPMTCSNENWCCMSTVCVLTAALLTVLSAPAASEQRCMLAAAILNRYFSEKALCELTAQILDYRLKTLLFVSVIFWWCFLSCRQTFHFYIHGCSF